MERKLKFDQIGYWSELKIEIIEKYARAYSTIITAQPQPFYHVYIDAFAGAGQHVRKKSGEVVAGTPIVALQVNPPFRHHYFIDLEPLKVGNLKGLIGERPDVDVLEGDCNRILLDKVFPNIRYEDYRRGLCLLDPYGLHLNWEVVQTAGQMESLEVFINFPVADMNRNVLWLDPEGVDLEDVARMTAFWGDDSWRRVAYSVAAQGDLFRESALEKKTAQNEAMAEAYRQRLIQVAGFGYVPPPLPMRNTKNAIVYYLFFASRNSAGGKIVKEIFDSYREKGC